MARRIGNEESKLSGPELKNKSQGKKQEKQNNMAEEQEITTTRQIMEWLKDKVENKIPVSPGAYVDIAAKLNVLLSDEHAILFRIQQKVAQMKAELVQKGETASKTKILVEASDEYLEYQMQKALISRIEEFIRIAKLQGRLKSEEYRGY